MVRILECCLLDERSQHPAVCWLPTRDIGPASGEGSAEQPACRAERGLLGTDSLGPNTPVKASFWRWCQPFSVRTSGNHWKLLRMSAVSTPRSAGFSRVASGLRRDHLKCQFRRKQSRGFKMVLIQPTQPNNNQHPVRLWYVFQRVVGWMSAVSKPRSAGLSRVASGLH